LVAMGMRFDDRITGRLDKFAKQAKIIHFELDKAEVGKNVIPTIAVIGDLGETLPAILPLISERRHQSWTQSLQEWKGDTAATDILNYEVDELIPPYVIRQLWHATNGAKQQRVLVVTDVGQHQMWESQYFIHEKSGQLLTSGGLGTMGYALPAAIGAQMSDRDALVWAVAGDGGFQMTLQELIVLQQEKLPVKIAVINNGFLGMVRQWQQMFYDKRYVGTPILSPDFVKLADAYGIPALRVTKPEQVVEAYEKAHATPGPFLIDFRVKEEVNVYPMIPPGAAVDESIRRPKPGMVQGYSGVQPSW
ncbi:MAG TPA: thiamine pyrophosphate-dependent enzyme, partial [Caldilineaceae bacterium]|nr:thiamine pyrophosphate-dependent enzyme [Caldilineaceae bacterium]